MVCIFLDDVEYYPGYLKGWEENLKTFGTNFLILKGLKYVGGGSIRLVGFVGVKCFINLIHCLLFIND